MIAKVLILFILSVVLMLMPVVACAAPSAPVTSGAVSVSQTGFTATWGAVSGVTGYRLDVATDSLFVNYVSGYAALDVATDTSYAVTGLSSGVTYFYRVRAYDADGSSLNSNISALLTLPATPSVPVATAAALVSQSGFTANWTLAGGATGYRLDVATDSAFTNFVSGYNDKNVLNLTSSVVTGLSAGTTYYYRVRAYNSGGTSIDSNTIVLATLPAVPAAPIVNGAVAVTQTGFTASWELATGATGYLLDVSTAVGFTTFVSGYSSKDVANVSSSGVSGLVAGVTYYYRVRAYSAGGTSTFSSTSVLVTLPPTPVAPVATAAAAITTTSFNATWNSVSAASGYLLDVATDSGFTSFVSGYNGNNVFSVTSTPVSGLTAGTVYYYRVRAYNNGGISINSNTITLSTIPTTPLANAATTVTQTSFSANWDAVSGATGYRLDVSVDPAFASFVSGYSDKNVNNVISSSVSGLTAGTVYYYRVRAYSSGGASASSNVISQTTLATPLATAAIDISQTGFSATWNPAIGASGYRLDVSTISTFTTFVAGFSNLDVANVTTWPITGLIAGTTYYYRVRAYNSTGASGNSNVISQATLATAVATAATAVSQTGFTANWGVAGGALGYQLDVATDAGFTSFVSGYNNKDVFSVTSSPVTGLAAGTVYYYRVRAHSSVATSINSNTISQITLATPVATVAVTVTQTGFSATWGAVSGATGYRLDVSVDPGFASFVTGYSDKNVLSVTTSPVTGLTAGTVYYYRVRAYNLSATSVSSNQVSVTTIPPALLATAATAISQTGITANWNSVTGASGYRLDVSTISTFTTFVAGFSNLDVANVTTFPITGLTAGTVYYYRLRAYNTTGTSGNSNVISQATLATAVATAATAVSQTGFTATWGVVAGALGYQLDVATDAGFTSFVSGYNNKDVLSVTSSPVTGLTAGTVYYYRVRAYTAVAISANSNIISQITLATPVAGAATTITQTGFSATWGAVSGATGYRLDVSVDPGFASFVTGYSDKNVLSVTTSPVTGLTAGTVYYYRVRAFNLSATSVSSNQISVTTIPPAPLAAAATGITQTGITANWNSVSGASGYRLDVATTSAFTTFVPGFSNLDVANVTTFPITGLASGAPSYYRVRAYNAAGTSGNSNVINQATLATVVATAATAVSQSGFTANWGVVAGALGYYLDVATDAGFTSFVSGYNNKDVLSVTSSPVTGLTAGTVYYYRVRSYSAVATSTNSNIISQITLATPVAGAATTVTQTGFSATWGAVSGATGYRLDVSVDPGFASFVTGYSDKNVLSVLTSPVTGLTAGTVYYYRVRAFNLSATSVSSNQISVTTIPPAPLAAAATGITQTGITANWGSVTGVSGYRLDVSTISTFTTFVAGFNNLDVANVTTLPITGLTAGTTYYYRVRAYNTSGASGNSNAISQTTVPMAPVATAATTVTQTGFKAIWGSVSGASSYRLDVATDSSFTSFVSGYSDKNVLNVTVYSVTSLTVGTTYYYRVRACNATATSTSSNVISQATLPPVPPAAPVATAATTVTQTGFNAIWGAVSGATGYRLDVSTDSAFASFVSGYNDLDMANVSTYSVTGLAGGTVYYYRVRAYNSGGASTNSNKITLTTLPATPVAPVAGSATSVTQFSFSANWGSVSGASGYRLDVSVDSGFASFVSGYSNKDVLNVFSYPVSGLTGGTTYYYRVRAYNAGGTSISSGVISQDTLAPTPPAVPVAAPASALTSSGFTANWSAVAGAAGYVLDVANDVTFVDYVAGYAGKDVANVTSLVVSGLNAGRSYYYRLRSYNAAGTSALSSTITAVTIPVAPLASEATGIILSGFSASWSAVSGASGYRLDVSIDPGFASFVSGYNDKNVLNVTSAPVSGLTAGTVYYYRVRAYNAGGVGSSSNTITLTTLPVAPLVTPANSVTQTSFNATWVSVSGAVGYQLDVATDAGFTGFVTGYLHRDVTNVTAFGVDGLSAGVTYYYRVRAYTSGGVGAYSSTIIQATQPAALAVPVALPATSVSATGFTANWGAVYGASGYRIDVSTVADFSSFVVGFNNYDVGNSISVSVLGLTPGSVYYYRVRDYNGGGSSTASNVIAVPSVVAPLTVTVQGSGGGSVHSNTAGIACISGLPDSCNALYDSGLEVVLTATPDSSSIFTGWSGACSGTGTCLVVMDSAKDVTATFDIMPPVRIFDAVTPRYFTTLQAAYDAATDGDEIQLRDGTLAGDLLADSPISVTIKGGFDATYTGNDLDTQLQGTVTLRQGTVRVDKVRM